MHVPKREIGMVALDLLRDGLSGPPMPARRVELACHIVERKSVGPAAATKTLEQRDEDV
jgi:DNA-binding LacI/PurR family transcriptional regulator